MEELIFGGTKWLVLTWALVRRLFLFITRFSYKIILYQIKSFNENESLTDKTTKYFITCWHLFKHVSTKQAATNFLPIFFLKPPSMASFSRILSPFSLFLLILVISTQTHLSFSARDLLLKSSDIHDLLPLYGFPVGLLPSNVKSYTLSDDGSFVIELDSACYVQFADLVYYGKTIKGKLSYGSLSDVSGIQVKKLFAWLPITGMRVTSDSKSIEFQVGFLSEALPFSMFESIPTCRKKACLEGKTEAVWGSFDLIFLKFSVLESDYFLVLF